MMSKLWRKPEEIIGFWNNPSVINDDRLEYKVFGDFWGIIEELKITLIVSREYENLLLALTVYKGSPFISAISVPHPSGIALNRSESLLSVACSRNPNQILTFKIIRNYLPRKDAAAFKDQNPLCMPYKSVFFPGSLYIHDIVYIGDKLYGSAAGHNAIIELNESVKYVWWPKCVERNRKPITDVNYLQLNSIAAGASIKDSFFTATTDKIENPRIGDPNYKVDKKGVVFSGGTRKPICDGLTRPHSARFYRKKLWVLNSGYGEFGFIKENKFEAVQKFDSWTRGLCFYNNKGFVCGSRVLTRFINYAPGTNLKKSKCEITILDMKTVKTVGSIQWPNGNQIFSVEAVPNTVLAFPHIHFPKKYSLDMKSLFYSWRE